MSRDRSDEVALAADGLPRVSWLEKLLMAAAAGVAACAVLDNALALDRPTRDRVEHLPVWGVELCLAQPTADDRQCWCLTATDLDEPTCRPIERAARAKFKGARRVLCLPDPERVYALQRNASGATAHCEAMSESVEGCTYAPPLSGIPRARR